MEGGEKTTHPETFFLVANPQAPSSLPARPSRNRNVTPSPASSLGEEREGRAREGSQPAASRRRERGGEERLGGEGSPCQGGGARGWRPPPDPPCLELAEPEPGPNTPPATHTKPGGSTLALEASRERARGAAGLGVPGCCGTRGC